MKLDEIDLKMIQKAKEQERLCYEMGELFILRKETLRKMDHYPCEYCTTHAHKDEMSYCSECGNTMCKMHEAEPNMCTKCDFRREDLNVY